MAPFSSYSFVLPLLWPSQGMTFLQGLLVTRGGNWAALECCQSIILESTRLQCSFLMDRLILLTFLPHPNFDQGKAQASSLWSYLLCQLPFVSVGTRCHSPARGRWKCYAFSTFPGCRTVFCSSISEGHYVVFLPCMYTHTHTHFLIFLAEMWGMLRIWTPLNWNLIAMLEVARAGTWLSNSLVLLKPYPPPPSKCLLN